MVLYSEVVRAFSKQNALALRLRSQGLSYTEILKSVSVSQSSLSLWCRDVQLTDQQKKRLRQLSLEGASRARARWNAIRRGRKRALLQHISVQAKGDVGIPSRRDRFIAGITLYAGEGDKTQERVGFSNADPLLLRFCLDWLCEFLEIDRGRFTAHLYLHRGRNEEAAKRYWTRVLSIRPSQFRKSYRPEQRVSHKGNIHIYGVCAVRLNSKLTHRKIMGWIRALLHSQNFFHSPVAQWQSTSLS